MNKDSQPKAILTFHGKLKEEHKIADGYANSETQTYVLWAGDELTVADLSKLEGLTITLDEVVV